MNNPQLSKLTSLMVIFLIALAAVGLAVAGLPAPKAVRAAAGPQGAALEAQTPPGRVSLQATVGYTFTYQGRLEQDTDPVDGSCDLTFKLFDSLSGGNQVGGDLTNSSVTVQNGYFTQLLNFGDAAFSGDPRWLEITINSCNGDGVNATLDPRVALTTAPYAVYALNGPWGTSDDTGLALTVNDIAVLHITPPISNPNVVMASSIVSDTAQGNPFFAIESTSSYSFVTTLGLQNEKGFFFLYNVPYTVPITSECDEGDYSTYSGGHNNVSMFGLATTIAGGVGNRTDSSYSSIGGGLENSVDGCQAPYTTIGGGYQNRVGGDSATVGGGNTASADFATVPGGQDNRAAGAYSFAAGRGAHANDDGSFVWGDSTGGPIGSASPNQFIARASGGFIFYTNSGLTAGAYLNSGSGTWNTLSDRNAKENFAPVDSQAVLEALAGIPLETWNYKAQADDIRHIGPMAQDFYAAFGVGENDTTISTVDADGVALAAIQGLYQRLQAAETENAALQQQVNDLEAWLAALEAGLAGGGQ